MKTNLFLITKYWRYHKKQFASMLTSIVILTAFLLIALLMERTECRRQYDDKLRGSSKTFYLYSNLGSDAYEEMSQDKRVSMIGRTAICKVMELYPEADLYFGVIIKPGILLELKESIAKCRKLINMGQYLCPDDFIWDYDSLGPLTWLQIPEKELEDLLGTYRLLLKDEKNAELLRTLKVYLENNMNYSLTAEKLYVHINTIRNRIDKVNQLLGIDWDSPLNRMKCEILLQYLKL